MPARSNDFQAVVYFVERHLAADATVTESASLTDRVTGQDREVDVLITCHVAGHPIRIGIECRDRTRRDDVGWVEQMRAKHDDLPTDRLVLVSASGFTAAAAAKAGHYNIEVVTPGHPIPDDGPLAQLRSHRAEFRDLTYRDLTSLRGVIEIDGHRRVIDLDPGHAVFDAASRQLGCIADLVRSTLDQADMRPGIATAPQGDQDMIVEVETPRYRTDQGEPAVPHLQRRDTSFSLLPLVALRFVYAVRLDVRPVELTPGLLRDTGYLYGSGHTAGHDTLLVFTQTGDDPHLAVRLTNAQGITTDWTADRASQTLLPHADD
ncbi:restriction endonuclease [Actinomadura geliboluensis]|uniref:restriction endonuclease n=1 Tax=Actinomadura geliboluensis TaxID=882440 RepID=UPI002610D99C|nr:restriction endonuclease [Actinomadura geliboluensis]